MPSAVIVPPLLSQADAPVRSPRPRTSRRVGPADHRAASLDAPYGNDGDSDDTLGDTLSVEDNRFERAEDRATLARLAQRITPREREVLRLRFVEDLTQADIGQRIGLSQLQVSRIIRRALAQLQASAGTHVASSVSRRRPAA